MLHELQQRKQRSTGQQITVTMLFRAAVVTVGWQNERLRRETCTTSSRQAEMLSFAAATTPAAAPTAAAADEHAAYINCRGHWEIVSFHPNPSKQQHSSLPSCVAHSAKTKVEKEKVCFRFESIRFVCGTKAKQTVHSAPLKRIIQPTNFKCKNT